jgi:hypothetical protein
VLLSALDVCRREVSLLVVEPSHSRLHE